MDERTDLHWQRVETVIQQAHRLLTTEQKAALVHAEADLYDDDGLPV